MLSAVYDAPLTTAPLLLSLVLAASGVAKLVDRETVGEAFVSLRLPGVLTRLKAPTLLPFAELMLALALLVTSGALAVVVALVALAVFVAYLVVIVRALGFDEPVNCSCFGKLGLGTVDRFTAVRNAVLVALALVTLYDATRGRSVVSRCADFDGEAWAWLLAVLVGIVLTWLIAGHRGGQEASAPSDAGDDYVRQPIPYAVLRTREDAGVTLREMAYSNPVLLLLVSPHCGSCLPVIERARTWQHKHENLRTVIVLSGDPDKPTGLQDEGDFDVMFDPSFEIGRLFAGGNPTAVLLGADGMLAGGPVSSKGNVLELLDEISEELSAVEQPAADDDAAAEDAPDASVTQTSLETPPALATPAPVVQSSPAPAVDDAADLPVTDTGVAETQDVVEDDEYVTRPTPYALFTDGTGTKVSLMDIGRAGPTVLLYVSTGCGSCKEVLNSVATWQASLRGVPIFCIVGHEAEVERLAPYGIEPNRALIDEPRAVATMMRLGTPSLFAIGPDEHLLAGPVSGQVDITATMEAIIGEVRAVRPEDAGDDQADGTPV